MSIINETERNNLLASMKKLLEEYEYSYTDEALDKIIDTWGTKKATLINAFKKHPKYIDGKFMIAFNHEYKRELDTKKADKFAKWLQSRVIPYYVNTLPEEIDKQREMDGCAYLPNKLYDFCVALASKCTNRTIDEEFAKTLDAMVPAIHVHNGEKTSRVINRLCKYLGYDKHSDYNKEFAKFADAFSPITISQRVILSVNPIDYLTMSFGNSWASCHTIDKSNKRGMPNNYSGCYSSGTVSYMLDGSSMVLYVVDKTYDGTDYEIQPKIHRQMFHWGEDKLVQGRLYPQDNDVDSGAYEPYRQIVQEIMSTIFEFPNLWSLKKGTSAASEFIISSGTHYRDYNNFRNCSLSRAKYKDNNNKFGVGAYPICIECGNEHDISDNINCCNNGETYTCQHCGRRIHDEDDVCWVDDDPYCYDCVSYCDDCGTYYITSEGHEVSGDRYVCDFCFNEHYTICEDCGEVVHNDDIVHVADEDKYVCEHCAKKTHERCKRCGNWFIKGSLNDEHLCKECKDKPKPEIKYITPDGWTIKTTSSGAYNGTYTITYTTNDDDDFWRF